MLVAANIVVKPGTEDLPPSLESAPVIGDILSGRLRAFADSMDLVTFKTSDPVVSGVQIRWGRTSRESQGKNEIVIATRSMSGKASGSSMHEKCTVYACGGTENGTDAEGKATGADGEVWALGGHGGQDPIRGGDALAVGTHIVLAEGGNGGPGERGGNATAMNKGRWASLAIGGDGGSNDNGKGGRGGNAKAVSNGSNAKASGGDAGESNGVEGALGGNAEAESDKWVDAVGGRGGKTKNAEGGRGGNAVATSKQDTANAKGGKGGTADGSNGGRGGDATAIAKNTATAEGGKGGTAIGSGFTGGRGGDVKAEGNPAVTTVGTGGDGLEGAGPGKDGTVKK